MLFILANCDKQRKKADDSQIIGAKENHLEPKWTQQKNGIRHQPTDEHFTSGLPLSLEA